MDTKNTEASCVEGIDLDFVENILEEKVLKFSVDSGSNPGDNFLSRIYSIDAVLAANPEQIVHLIIKAYPALAARQAFLNRSNVFLKEIQVYRDFIPALINFQNNDSAQIIKPAVPPFLGGKAIDFAAETCSEISGAVRSLDNYLAMIDIRRTWGYKMALKTEGLDEAHIKLVIIELARFHALGWAYKERNQLSCLAVKFPFLKDTMMTERGTDLEEMTGSNFQLVLNIAKKYFPEDSKVVCGVQRLIDLEPMTIMETFLPPDGVIDEGKVNELLRDDDSSLEETSEPWTTLCHGDCWVNNMLFRYNNENCPGKPTDVIFVDLQIARVGCPTTDLAYLLFTSTTAETRKKHLNTLFQLYHDTFLDTCKILKVEPLHGFSMEKLLSKFRRARLYGFTAASLVLPIILCENCPDLDIDTSKENGETPKNMTDVFSNMLSSGGENKELERRFVEIFNELVEERIF